MVQAKANEGHEWQRLDGMGRKIPTCEVHTWTALSESERGSASGCPLATASAAAPPASSVPQARRVPQDLPAATAEVIAHAHHSPRAP